MPSTTAETLSLVNDRKVSVAPLVLLSVVDHYNRAASTSSKNKRVVGVLLGQNDGKTVRVSNSFAGTLPIFAIACVHALAFANADLHPV